jgi:hypothetical protein
MTVGLQALGIGLWASGLMRRDRGFQKEQFTRPRKTDTSRLKPFGITEFYKPRFF